MKRDTRINLLFLAGFLAISLPGAVVLFRKKLDPNAARMDQPDAVVSRLPYMAPPLARPGVKWVVPPRTQAWLEQLNRQHGGKRALLFSRSDPWSPVISDDHLMQVVDLSRDSSGAHTSIVLWDAPQDPASHPEFSLSSPGTEAQPGRLESFETVVVPEPVKRELMGMNEVQPPARIARAKVTFANWPDAGLVTVSGDFAGRAEHHHSTVTIESSAVAR